jgi:signal transduction histidine kinase
MSSNEEINVDQVLAKIIDQKRIQYDNQFQFTLKSELRTATLNNVDVVELERSVSNLINNAIEASSNGSEITVDLTNQNEMIKIQIKDQGYGISAENLKKIGMKGFTANKANGTGIGLFYAKQFVERLGGKLMVDSVLNQGTTVSMILPVV